jgi:GR25 family glycosyltransferase involved in LPS biosynthesis
MSNIKYYLIHGVDKSRKQVMTNEFNKWGLNPNEVKWMEHPNKDELTEELCDILIVKGPSYSSGVFIPENRMITHKGLISCTYKHYLCLQDIIENNYEYGVIIEDNIHFINNIPNLINTYITQLNTIYGDWDIVFDCNCNWGNYIESPIKPDIFVYPKSNEITNQCHGGTKAASFYLIKNSCAKKLYQHYLPFNNSPDWWMNDLFRKLNVKSFWVEPSQVRVHNNHVSTVGLDP